MANSSSRLQSSYNQLASHPYDFFLSWSCALQTIDGIVVCFGNMVIIHICSTVYVLPLGLCLSDTLGFGQSNQVRILLA